MLQTNMELDRSNKKFTAWALALSYIAFIYLTLSVIGIPVAMLRQHGVLRLTLIIFYALSFFSLIGILILYRVKEIWRYAALIAVFGLYLILTKHIHLPEEKIHFFEYGIVGILFARAVGHHINSLGKILTAALALSGLAGAIDEAIQGFIPGRHYDTRDIFLNIVAASLGLIIFSIFPHRKNLD